MTVTIPPTVWTWDGEVMRPALPKLADRYFVIGDRYRLAPEEERSMAAHRWYFATIREVWKTMPDRLVLQYPSPEALRKLALCRAGYCDVETIVCRSKAEAQRWARFIRPLNAYDLVLVTGRIVQAFKAHSQSAKAMKGPVFKESIDAVLNTIAEMVNVDVGPMVELARAA